MNTGTPRMFCLPYAAGSFRVFSEWQQELPQVEVAALELPGRGRRFAEQLHSRIDPLVKDLLGTVQEQLDRPYVLFGHSLGGLLAFELARRLRDRDIPPLALLVSGIRAPDTTPPAEPVSALSDTEFRQRLIQLNGTPKELLESDELMELMIPVLRADFAAADHYVYREEQSLPCPIMAFGSLRDPEVEIGALRGWQRQTSVRFSAHAMPGDHFFLHSHRDLLLSKIRGELEGLVEPGPDTATTARTYSTGVRK